MDEVMRDDFYAITQDDWTNYGYVGFVPDGARLENEIHPILDYDTSTLAHGAAGSKRVKWKLANLELGQTNYDVLKPMLRLASVMLTSPMSLRFLYYVISAPRVPTTPTPTHKDGLPVLQFSPDDTPYATLRPLIISALSGLEDYVTFNFAYRDTQGWTAPAREQWPSGISIEQGKPMTGYGSITYLKIYYLLHLKYLLETPEQNECQIIAWQFKFAVTLCHEITHALHWACNRDLVRWHNTNPRGNLKDAPRMEAFFNGMGTAELGYTWENEVFGGMITQDIESDPRITNEPSFVAPWPNCMHRSDCDPIRRKEGWLANLHLISLYYMNNIQRQEFWDFVRTQPPSDYTLRIRKLVGFRYEGPDTTVNEELWDVYNPKFSEETFKKKWPVLPNSGPLDPNENPKRNPKLRLDIENQTEDAVRARAKENPDDAIFKRANETPSERQARSGNQMKGFEVTERVIRSL